MTWFDRMFRRKVRYKPVGTTGKTRRYLLDKEAILPGFTVRIWTGFREEVEVEYTRDANVDFFYGERAGRRWQGILIYIPREFESSRVSALAEDLKSAFDALKTPLVVTQPDPPKLVSQADREAAVAELRTMGYETEVSLDGKMVKTKRIPGAPHPSIEQARAEGPRFTKLVEIVSGKTTSWKTLAQSENFEV